MRHLTKKKKIIIVCTAIIVFFIALGVTLYPMLASQYSEKHQSMIHTSYQKEVEEIDNTAILEAKEKALIYNKSLVPGVREIEAFSNDDIENALESYADQLNITNNGIMGYVEIPRINVTLPIYHGTAEKTLEVGVGHLVGSSLPIGGESTHTILTGHSGMASKKMFSDLPEMEVGDVFYLEVLNEMLAYQVDQIVTVLPEDTTYLQIEQGQDYCTLITCTPFGVNTHRLLVRGHRIPYEETEKEEITKTAQEEQNQSVWEQQYKRGIIIGLASIVIAAIIAAIVALIKKRKNVENTVQYTEKEEENYEEKRKS